MKKLFFLWALIFCSALLYAQIAADMDLLLNSDEVSYGLAARFILSAAEVMPENISEVDAFRTAQSKGWIDEGIEPSQNITLGAFSLLCMKAFDLKGGIMYSIFPNKRYAYREMMYKNFIQGKNESSQTISGERLILILGRILNSVEENL